mgnify:CR=1 FL=1
MEVIAVRNDIGITRIFDDIRCVEDITIIRCITALSSGSDYRLIVTTQGGLYRYDTGDRVCIRSMENGIPRLEFVGRDSLTSDLCGEKLTEAFVRRAMLRTAPGLPDHALLQGVNTAPPYYRLILSDGLWRIGSIGETE